jgi:hypothetical protein
VEVCVLREDCSAKFCILFEDHIPEDCFLREDRSAEVSVSFESRFPENCSLIEIRFTEIRVLREGRFVEVGLLREGRSLKSADRSEFPVAEVGVGKDESLEMSLAFPCLFQYPLKFPPEGIEELA